MTWLLVSDVDDTLVGDGDGWGRFVEIVAAAPRLRVVLNSSRPIASVRRTLAALDPAFEPAGLIGAMGTEIELGGRRDESWSQRYADWDRAVVDRVMAQFGFAPHDAEFQTPLKASFEVPQGDAQWRVREALDATGLPCRVVASGDSDLDVLPAGADKASATLHVATRFNVPSARLIVAGDSANDLAMFNVSQKGIVVGNARRELRYAVDAGRVFFARRHRADGVLEGLAHWGAIEATQPLLEKKGVER